MKKALFGRMMLVAASAAIICCFIAILIIANNEKENKESEMQMLLGLMSVTYENEPDHDYALAEEFSKLTDNARIVFIRPDGKVFVDTGIIGEPSDSHINRTEVRQAIQTGTGSDIRRSDTLGKMQLYVAKKMQNGDIIRISYNIKGFEDFIPQLVPVMILAIIISLITCLIITQTMVRSIMKPLNDAEQSLVSMKNGDYSKEIPENKFDDLNQFIYVFNKMRLSILDYVRSLEKEQQLSSFILENMNEGIILFDNNLNIAMTNSSSMKFLECNDNYIGKSIHHMVHNNRILTSASDAVDNLTSSEYDIQIGTRILKVITKPIVYSISDSENQDMQGGLMVLFDVTDKRLSEKMRQEFFSNAGHELKTPLTAVIGFAELFENGLVPENKREEYMSKIIYESKRMSAIITDILEISQIETAQYIPSEEKTACNIKEIAQSVAENIYPLTVEKDLSVTVTGDGFDIFAVSKHMYELIENILSNAVKYNVQGGKSELNVYKEENQGIISCSDTGIGIPYESQSRVFERFFRVDKGRSTKEGSTGLGLAIVKHLVNAYHGTIKLNSRPGLGTTITIRLPLEQI